MLCGGGAIILSAALLQGSLHGGYPITGVRIMFNVSVSVCLRTHYNLAGLLLALILN